ncbi:Mo-dependent nitrogenase C-terminal domain-containing protein [Stenomitos frigidus]|uniref:Nitrogenase n=1 Tax=Stenomitos frigidus ULC18 TaxID=2107698 RepID=A0A2T1E545_9CYAN|nr:Mo-dependent nitrogenase C-terminal domain-containing protein [Stenomitos frigidus]PSB27873.1 nitrogenase [Stenomitos frigidus ULC18]
MSDLDLAFHASLHPEKTSDTLRLNVLQPVRQWLDRFPVSNPALARLLYKLIPGQCPFERDVVVFGRKLAHIPPLCKLNPLYDQLVGLRFRSMCYLVDVCGETL